MRATTLVLGATIVLALAAPMSASAAPQGHGDPGRSTLGRRDLPKPDLSDHNDCAPTTAGGSGDGRNSLAFGSFESGDLLVVLGTATGHAGEWDDYYHASDLAKCVWSANTTPLNGVQREPAVKYRAYDIGYGLWVPSVSLTNRLKARNYCRAQLGEPYDIGSSKADQSRWYCSKLLWASYRYMAGVDLDGDGGYWVWPVDLINDPATSIFAQSS